MISEQSPLKGSVLAVSTGILGKILGFSATLFIASYLGATNETDVVFFLYNIIFIAVSFFSCFNNNVLVPRLIKLRDLKDTKKWSETLSIGLILGLTPLILLFLVGWYFAADLIALISQFKAPIPGNLEFIVQLMSPLILFIFLNDFLVNLMQARGNFTFLNVVSITQGLCLILCVGLGHQLLSSASISLGFLVSQAVVFFLLTYVLRGWFTQFTFTPLNWLEIKSFLGLVLPVLTLQISQLFVMFLPDYLASGMPAGTLTAILNARKIFDLVPTLLIYPIVAVGYTRLCTLATSKQTDDFTALCLSLNFFLISIVLPLSIYISLYAEPIIQLLFSHGKYSSQALAVTTTSLQWFPLGAFALVTHSLAGRALVATQDRKALYAYALSLFLGGMVYAITLIILSEKFGFEGIAMGTALYHGCFLSILGYFLMQKYIGKFSGLKLMLKFLGLILVSTPALLITYMIVPPSGGNSWLSVPLSFILMVLSLGLTHVGLKTESYRFVRERLHLLLVRRGLLDPQ